MNQPEVEANTCNWRQARENACEQVAIGLSFTSDWLRKSCEIFHQSQSEVKQNHSKTRITFDTQLKTALIQTTEQTKTNNLSFLDLVCSAV